MIRRVVQDLITQLRQAGIRDERLLQAMAAVPRENFVDEALTHKAWDNTALPIGYGQTISQPFMVAKMTELLEPAPQAHVLEIGTGSGYQTAILAHLAAHVYSVERVKGLQWYAKRRFKQLDLHNISTRHGDGWEGWPSRGPFDGIIVTAAASDIPPALLGQLADNGRMVIPVGEQQQMLKLIRRRGNDFHTQSIGTVRFVPLIHGDLG